MVKNLRVSARVTPEEKEKLDLILNELNSNPTNKKKITIKTILNQFVEDYYKTAPQGLILETKELQKEVKEVEHEITKLMDKKNHLLAQIKDNQILINETETNKEEQEYNNRLFKAKEDFKMKSGYSNRKSEYSNRKLVPNENIIKKLAEKYEVKFKDLKEIV